MIRRLGSPRRWHVELERFRGSRLAMDTVELRRGSYGPGLRVRWDRTERADAPRPWRGRDPIDMAASGFRAYPFGVSVGVRRYRRVATHIGLGRLTFSILHGMS